jgi:hypothetical protein
LSLDYQSYSQSFGRYRDVRDNMYAYEAAFQGPDYLRVQIDKSRDFRYPRAPDQLLACEGFQATFMFRLAEHLLGEHYQTENISDAYPILFRALHGLMQNKNIDFHRPWLLEFAAELIRQDESLGRPVLLLLFDLSHGSFFIRDWRKTWQACYDASLTLDRASLINLKSMLDGLRETAIQHCLKGVENFDWPTGPVIPVKAPKVLLKLPGDNDRHGKELSFDLNTVSAGILRVAGYADDKLIKSLIESREAMPFTSLHDATRRGYIPEHVVLETAS